VEVHGLLDAAGAECFCKTSGKRGLHICVPLAARYEYELARRFAELVARLVHEQLPDVTSVVRSPSQRRNKVYIDFLQNSRGQTMAAPYSLRPVPNAQASAPLKWSEVNKKLDPARFTMATMRRRLDKTGDLWKPLLGKGIDLEKCISRLSR
jgi:bifunctional non-homologous end joining protein LigD